MGGHKGERLYRVASHSDKTNKEYQKTNKDHGGFRWTKHSPRT